MLIQQIQSITDKLLVIINKLLYMQQYEQINKNELLNRRCQIIQSQYMTIINFKN